MIITIFISGSSTIQPLHGKVWCVNAILIIINKEQALVIQRLDSVIQRISLYPVDSAASFSSTYPLYSDLSLNKI